MSVKVRFFAALREAVGASELDVDWVDSSDAKTIWANATPLPLDAHVLVAINQSYAGQDSPVSDGDEVAFFPPVTGG